MARAKRGGRPRHGRRRRRGGLRRKRAESPLLDSFFGARTARRLRIGSALAIALLFFGGCAVFLLESQVLGRLAFGLGVGWALCWLAAWYLGRGGQDPVGDVRRVRVPLIGVGAAIVVAGWVCYFAVWEELGLLLVVLGALPLGATLIGVRRDGMASPMDGPLFGETEG